MTLRFKSKPAATSRITTLEARVTTLAKLLDEVWDLATDALGDAYLEVGALPTNAKPTPHESALHEIAERAASILGSIHVNERIAV